MQNVQNLYDQCLDYLNMQMQPFKEFSCFKWMELETISWEEVESSIRYLSKKGVNIDDTKCFDQLRNLKKFKENFNQTDNYKTVLSHKKRFSISSHQRLQYY
jgi:hypothetical protein